MLGFGWTEMLVIGVVALIVIGPKDLPIVMARVGKIVGQIRRMGNEFQREINKTTGLNEIRNLRSSITEPLRKTSEEIRKEFNTMTSTGVQPSGAIKPTNPKIESVVDEIKAAAGIAPPVAAATVAAPVMAAKPKKAPAKAKAVPASTVTTSELAPVSATVPAPVKAAKPAAKKAAASVVEAPAKAAKAPAKKSVDAALAAKATPIAKKPAAKKVAEAAPVVAAPKKVAAKKPAAKTGDA